LSSKYTNQLCSRLDEQYKNHQTEYLSVNPRKVVTSVFLGTTALSDKEKLSFHKLSSKAIHTTDTTGWLSYAIAAQVY
jgi:hypothetical protein